MKLVGKNRIEVNNWNSFKNESCITTINLNVVDSVYLIERDMSRGIYRLVVNITKSDGEKKKIFISQKNKEDIHKLFNHIFNYISSGGYKMDE